MEIELGQFIKLEGGIKLLDKFYVGEYIHSKEFSPADGIN